MWSADVQTPEIFPAEFFALSGAYELRYKSIFRQRHWAPIVKFRHVFLHVAGYLSYLKNVC